MDFQKIADTITPLFPENWQQARLFCQLDKSSYEYFFFVKIGNEYIQCFDLEKNFSITKKELRYAFKKLFNIMNDAQKEDGWSVATIMLNSSGDFKIEYDYTNTETGLDYKQKWKNRYLD